MIIQNSNKINAFGDSFTVGVGASNSTKAYINVLASRLNLQVNNLGRSGGGVIEMFKQAVTNSATIQQTNNFTPCTVLCGFNDAIRGGVDPLEKTKIYNGYMAFFANMFLSSALPASSSLVNKVGSWSVLSSTSNYPLKSVIGLSGTGRSSSTLNDSMSFTTVGSSLVIGYITNDEAATGIQLSSFDVKVDGQVIATVNTNNESLAVSDSYWSNAYSIGAFVATDLGAGSHTVEIVNKQNKTLLIDYVGTLSAPSVCPQIYVGSIPLLADAGYAGRPNNPSDQSFLECSQMIVAASKKFRGYPITYVDVNEFFDESGISTDNIHPNDLGHAQISTSFVASMMGTDIRNVEDSSYTDASGLTKSFYGVNGRYNPDGTFAKIDSTKPSIGVILSTMGATNTVGFGVIQADSSGGFRYVYQVDKQGKDSMSYGKGSISLNGNGTTTAFNVAHGCPYTPDSVVLTPRSQDVRDGWWISAIGSTNFTISFATAPAVGTNNIRFDFKCR